MKTFSKEQLKQLLEAVFEFLKVHISKIHIRLQVWAIEYIGVIPGPDFLSIPEIHTSGVCYDCGR